MAMDIYNIEKSGGNRIPIAKKPPGCYFSVHKVSTRNLDSKTTKTGREKVSDSKCNLVTIENLYRNYSLKLF